MRSSYLGKQNSWVPIKNWEIPKTEIPIKKGSAPSTIMRTQFPLMIAWTFTFQKVQDSSLEQGVIDSDLRKQKSFGLGQIYAALSRVLVLGLMIVFIVWGNLKSL